MGKRLLIRIRTIFKAMILIGISVFLILGGLSFAYHPIYSVSLNDEFLGYTDNKVELQKRINEYAEKADGEDSNVAFVEMNQMPEYKLCLLKKDIVTNDDEIFDKITGLGTTYYRYFAIGTSEEEKVYVGDIETAEAIIEELKEKESNNIDELIILEKYEEELQEFTSKEDAISNLYVEKPVVVVAKTITAKKYSSSGSVNTGTNLGSGAPSIGISLIKPVSGTLSSRFGARSRIRSSAHTGLDIATSKGTSIVAAAAGTVSFAGYKGSYGNLLVIDHGNGVQTYYAHCNTLNVSVGTKVSQGQFIATVGSTGNSTGPHLHLEVRVNGVAYNPQNYVYK